MNLYIKVNIFILLLLYFNKSHNCSGIQFGNNGQYKRSKYEHNEKRVLPLSTKYNPQCEALTCGKYYCNVNSKCINGACVCKRGYASLPYEIFQCCYLQKFQFTAFFLELLISFGVGHFYIGSNIIGSIKLVVFSFFCVIFCVIFIIWLKKDYKNERLNPNTEYYTSILFVCSFSMCIFIYLTWQIIDIVLFALNIYKDENGINLLSWEK